MAQRRYGPTRGAGTVIVELEGEKGIEPAALGWSGYAGILERGRPGELIEAQNKGAFSNKCGGIIDGSLLPDACLDYYEIANGAGGLLLVRVTDGNEEKAEATVYARRGDLLTPMGTLKADNGGRWGGKLKRFTKDMSNINKLTEITLDIENTTFTTDEWKGGYIELSAVANKQYPIVGNTSAGIVTVAADQTMLTDHGGSADLRYYLVRENESKAVSYAFHDGEEKPDTEFGLSVYVDGNFFKKYPNLAVDPADPRYWVDVINNDDSNWIVEAVDLWTGAYTADVRPANHYGKTAAVTATVLTAEIFDFTINSPGGGDPTFALGTTTDADVAQKITITMTSPTAGDAVSDKFGALGTVTLGTLFDPHNAAGGALKNKWAPPFIVTAGASPLVATDTLVVNYKPFVLDSLIEGHLYPDKPNAKRTFFRIVDNDHKSITVADGSDLTVDGGIGDYFLVEAPLELEGGRDGNADLVDADYNQQAWDTGTSPFNRVMGRNLGLIKFANPGITATAVQKAGKSYAEAKNHQFRQEIPSTITTESGAISQIDDTVGRSDFSVASFPSYGYVTDPNDTGEGKLKLVSLTGKIHGREARIAADYDGYHKAEAGVEAILNGVLKLPTGEAILDEEQLNPSGISVIKKSTGNYIIWGDRTLNVDPTWKWKHQREQMSYYEHVLQENFDWIIFMINDAVSDKLALSALQNYFLPEWVKRALRGDTFEEAAKFKIDAELNTDATRAGGDKIAEVSLRLADTTERFIIRIGKQGIFESVG